MKHLLRPTLILTICTFLGQFISFFVNVIAAKLFGASAEMDAYLAAQTLPNYISIVLLGGLSYVFIPMFVEYKTLKKEDKAWSIANSIIIVYVILLTLIALVGVLWAKPILKLMVPGLSGEALTLATNLSIFIWPTTIFNGLLAILTSLYHAYEQFIYQAVATVVSGCLYILILLIFSNQQNGIYTLSIGLLLSSVINVFLLIKVLGKQKKISFAFRDKAVYTILQLQLPLILAAAFSNATKIVERYFASELSLGAISYLSYADKVRIAVAAILGGGIGFTIFPQLAKNFSDNNIQGLKKNISMGLKLTCLVVVPVILFGAVLSTPIIRLMFQRGNFGEVDTYNVAKILPWFLLSILGATLGNITSRTFYVLKETRIIAGIGVLQVLFYIIYMPVLCNYMGNEGMALAVTLLWNTSFFLQFIILDIRYKMIERNEVLLSLCKIIGASLIPAVILKFLIPFSTLSDISTILFGGSIGAICYFVLLHVFKLKELLLIKDFAIPFRKFNKRYS